MDLALINCKTEWRRFLCLCELCLCKQIYPRSTGAEAQLLPFLRPGDVWYSMRIWNSDGWNQKDVWLLWKLWDQHSQFLLSRADWSSIELIRLASKRQCHHPLSKFSSVRDIWSYIWSSSRFQDLSTAFSWLANSQSRHTVSVWILSQWQWDRQSLLWPKGWVNLMRKWNTIGGGSESWRSQAVHQSERQKQRTTSPLEAGPAALRGIHHGDQTPGTFQKRSRVLLVNWSIPLDADCIVFELYYMGTSKLKGGTFDSRALKGVEEKNWCPYFAMSWRFVSKTLETFCHRSLPRPGWCGTASARWRAGRTLGLNPQEGGSLEILGSKKGKWWKPLWKFKGYILIVKLYVLLVIMCFFNGFHAVNRSDLRHFEVLAGHQTWW